MSHLHCAPRQFLKSASALAVALIALVCLAPGDAHLGAQNRMTFPVVSIDSGHVALGLWRQLPTGTDGAYQLLANLIGLPRAPSGVRATPVP
jgi:hypothetical protein